MAWTWTLEQLLAEPPQVLARGSDVCSLSWAKPENYTYLFALLSHTPPDCPCSRGYRLSWKSHGCGAAPSQPHEALSSRLRLCRVAQEPQEEPHGVG